MANQIKTSGAGLALQVTKPARSTGLVEENSDGDPTYRAETVVYGVNGNLLVFDRDEVEQPDRAEIVASAARDARSLHRGAYASIQVAGNGYQAELPGATEAGFDAGTESPVIPAPNLLLITDGSNESVRRARDLETIRQSQTE